MSLALSQVHGLQEETDVGERGCDAKGLPKLIAETLGHLNLPASTLVVAILAAS